MKNGSIKCQGQVAYDCSSHNHIPFCESINVIYLKCLHINLIINDKRLALTRLLAIAKKSGAVKFTRGLTFFNKKEDWYRG